MTLSFPGSDARALAQRLRAGPPRSIRLRARKTARGELRRSGGSRAAHPPRRPSRIHRARSARMPCTCTSSTALHAAPAWPLHGAGADPSRPVQGVPDGRARCDSRAWFLLGSAGSVYGPRRSASARGDRAGDGALDRSLSGGQEAPDRPYGRVGEQTTLASLQSSARQRRTGDVVTETRTTGTAGDGVHTGRHRGSPAASTCNSRADGLWSTLERGSGTGRVESRSMRELLEQQRRGSRSARGRTSGN